MGGYKCASQNYWLRVSEYNNIKSKDKDIGSRYSSTMIAITSFNFYSVA